MVLQLKIESLRARGELSAEERDRLLAALEHSPAAPASARKRLVTPLRLFLGGVLCGLGIAYLVWGVLGVWS